MCQLFAGGFHPSGDTRLRSTPILTGQDTLGHSAMNAHRALAQAGAGNRLPRTIDGKLLDFIAQPVQPDARADLEIDSGGFDHTYAVNRRKFHHVEGGVVGLQTGDASSELVRNARPWSWALTSAGIARRRGFDVAEPGRSERIRSPSISIVWLFATALPVSTWVQSIWRIARFRF